MARICVICKKKPHVGFNVSHANNKTKRRWLPNLQPVRIYYQGATRRVRVCTRCIKSGAILKAA